MNRLDEIVYYKPLSKEEIGGVVELLLARLKAEVAHFKGEVLNLYKQHIESLSMIPGAEEKKKKAPEASKAEEQPEPAPEEAPKEEPAAEAQPAAAPAEPGQEASFEEYQDITFED